MNIDRLLYRIGLMKIRKPKPIEAWQGYSPYHPSGSYCNIEAKGNTQVLTMPDGTVILCQVWSRVYTGVDQTNYAIVKVLVNIKPSV